MQKYLFANISICINTYCFKTLHFGHGFKALFLLFKRLFPKELKSRSKNRISSLRNDLSKCETLLKRKNEQPSAGAAGGNLPEQSEGLHTEVERSPQ
jgi:hypothetical protein